MGRLLGLEVEKLRALGVSAEPADQHDEQVGHEGVEQDSSD